MKVMTVDHSNGEQNPEFEWLRQKLKESLSEVTDMYMKECFENDIETLSADGAFFEMAFQCLTESRLKCAYAEKNNIIDKNSLDDYWP